MESRFFKNPNNNSFVMTWNEVVDATEASINYTVFLPYPFCEDGYKEEMSEAIHKRFQWQIGMGLIYKEKLPLEEILGCLAFTRSYRKIYELIVRDPNANINCTIDEFLDFVDSSMKRLLLKFQKKYSVSSVRDINALLTKKEFDFQIDYC
jgi:hypothetical protein